MAESGQPYRSWVGMVVLAAACASPPERGSEADETTGEAIPADDRLLVVPPLGPCDDQAELPAGVRVVSWNVSAGRQSSLAEVQAVLEALEADVVVLQELDVRVRRTGSVDQPQVLADALGHAHAFAQSVEFDGGAFGLAVFSRLPFSAVRRISLDSQGAYEPRIALDVTVCAGPRPLRVVDVHADFMPEANVRSLGRLGEELGVPLESSMLVAGDLNATPETAGVRALIAETGTLDVLAEWDPGPTRNDQRIDYVLADPSLAASVVEAARVTTEASDHVPLRVDVALR